MTRYVAIEIRLQGVEVLTILKCSLLCIKLAERVRAIRNRNNRARRQVLGGVHGRELPRQLLGLLGPGEAAGAPGAAPAPRAHRALCAAPPRDGGLW